MECSVEFSLFVVSAFQAQGVGVCVVAIAPGFVLGLPAFFGVTWYRSMVSCSPAPFARPRRLDHVIRGDVSGYLQVVLFGHFCVLIYRFAPLGRDGARLPVIRDVGQCISNVGLCCSQSCEVLTWVVIFGRKVLVVLRRLICETVLVVTVRAGPDQVVVRVRAHR